jgi:tRNA (mo5U34)-methyltransferase
VPTEPIQPPQSLADRPSLAEQVNSIAWYHSIDLGQAGGGIITPGNPPIAGMLEHGLPEVKGKSVLDIGAWDGFWSYEAERRGAARVVAMDHYAWCLDFPARLRYWESCEAQGVVPDSDLDMTEFWHPDTMPGRAGFELAHRILESSVEPVMADFMTADPKKLGTFDVVLFLGVLYHLREPLTALERVRRLTSEVAVIETEAITVLGLQNAGLLEFHDRGGLRGDYTNWFVPTEVALHALCQAAGFSRVETRIGPPQMSRVLKTTARRATDRATEMATGVAQKVTGSETLPGTDRRSRDESHPAITRYRIAVHAYP